MTDFRNRETDNFAGVTTPHDENFAICFVFAIVCYGEKRVGPFIYILTYELQFLGLLRPWLGLRLLDRRGTTG